MLIVTNLNWRAHAAFENNFDCILVKHAPKKTKFYGRIKNPISIRTFASKWWLDHISKTKQKTQKILVTSGIRQIWINKPNCSAWRNLTLIIIPNHFEKHVNRTSQIEIVIYKKISCCLKRINCYQNKRMSLELSINISGQLQTR